MNLGLPNPLLAFLAILIVILTSLTAAGVNDHSISAKMVSESLEVVVNLTQPEGWITNLDDIERKRMLFGRKMSMA